MVQSSGGVSAEAVEERLKSSLQLSFQKVREDMEQLRQWQQFLVNDTRETRKEIDDLRQDTVTNDKFNILKIYLHEVREELKKIEKLHQTVKVIHDEYFNEEDLQEELQPLHSELLRLEKKLNTAVSQQQFDSLVTEINMELDHIKEDMTSVENRGGKVVDARLDHFKEQFSEKVTELKQAVNQYRNENSTFVNKQQIDTLIHDMNQEFNALKAVVEQLSSTLEEANERIRKLRKKVYSQEEEREQQRQALAHQKAALRGKKYDSNYWLQISSTILIILAFASLLGSVIAYGSDALSLIDWFVGGAIILFVIGIALRITVMVRTARA